MQFDNTSCSQCGNSFGPGDQGYSHCKDHQKETMKNSESQYINAGYRLERAIIANKSSSDIIAKMHGIRVMLEQEAIDDHEQARQLIERGRQEARSE